MLIGNKLKLSQQPRMLFADLVILECNSPPLDFTSPTKRNHCRDDERPLSVRLLQSLRERSRMRDTLSQYVLLLFVF
jgi:hypothetical protein